MASSSSSSPSSAPHTAVPEDGQTSPTWTEKRKGKEDEGVEMFKFPPTPIREEEANEVDPSQKTEPSEVTIQFRSSTRDLKLLEWEMPPDETLVMAIKNHICSFFSLSPACVFALQDEKGRYVQLAQGVRKGNYTLKLLTNVRYFPPTTFPFLTDRKANREAKSWWKYYNTLNEKASPRYGGSLSLPPPLFPVTRRTQRWHFTTCPLLHHRASPFTTLKTCSICHISTLTRCSSTPSVATPTDDTEYLPPGEEGYELSATLSATATLSHETCTLLKLNLLLQSAISGSARAQEKIKLSLYPVPFRILDFDPQTEDSTKVITKTNGFTIGLGGGGPSPNASLDMSYSHEKGVEEELPTWSTLARRTSAVNDRVVTLNGVEWTLSMQREKKFSTQSTGSLSKAFHLIIDMSSPTLRKRPERPFHFDDDELTHQLQPGQLEFWFMLGMYTRKGLNTDKTKNRTYSLLPLVHKGTMCRHPHLVCYRLLFQFAPKTRRSQLQPNNTVSTPPILTEQQKTSIENQYQLLGLEKDDEDKLPLDFDPQHGTHRIDVFYYHHRKWVLQPQKNLNP